MKSFQTPHSWQVTPKEAIEIQKKLAQQVQQINLKNKARFIAGLDCAFLKEDKQSYCYAAGVLWDVQTKVIVEANTARQLLTLPYIPGLLSFREAPTMLAALAKLSLTPDVIIVDGQGLAHPRRLGIACHIGIITDIPTLGCGKSRLLGEYIPPPLKRGSKSLLQDKNEIIGSVLRTRDNVKPIFVSVGHKITLAEAEHIILDTTLGYRLPEPIRLADKLVGQAKRGEFKIS